MYAALPYNFLEYIHMNWNPYKRIAALEQEVTNLNDELVMQSQMLHDLGVKHKALHNWVVNNPYAAAAPVRSEGKLVSATAEVADAAEQKRIKQREYQRVYYAKQRAKARQREYAAAYRARKKAEKDAAQAIGGTA